MTPYPIWQIILSCLASVCVAVLVATFLSKRRFPLPESQHRAGCVDGLRGYLALAVLFHHFIIWIQVSRLGLTWSAPQINFFNQLGAGSVALFFMITGLLFYPIALKGFRNTNWLDLLTRRVFRIVPMVFVSFSLVVGLIIARGYHHVGLQTVKNSIMWLSALGEPDLLGYKGSGGINSNVLWSLKFEWEFYLFVLPACALAMDWRMRLPSFAIPVALFVGSLAARPFANYFPIINYLPLFAIGMLGYEASQNDFLKSILKSTVFSFVSLAAILIAMTIRQTPYGLSMAFFAVFFFCVAAGNSLFGLLSLAPSLVLGEVSYSVYLLHGIVLSVAFTEASALFSQLETATLPVLLPAISAEVVVLSAGAFLSIERPLIKIGLTVTQYIRAQSKRPSYSALARAE